MSCSQTSRRLKIGHNLRTSQLAQALAKSQTCMFNCQIGTKLLDDELYTKHSVDVATNGIHTLLLVLFAGYFIGLP
jgi:hypothetical protein